MKRVAVLGSTGSVGSQTLDVLERLEGEFEVVALGAGRWSEAFSSQIQRWRPSWASIAETTVPTSPPLSPTEVLRGPEAIERLIEQARPEIVVLASPGLVGLRACLAALRYGATVALANKETLVSAGALVTRTARQYGGTIVPIDSEHCAIWQCLRGESHAEVSGLILTSSGGAFRDTPLEQLETATPQQALNHPTWSMGPKITVDSATLMNKGLEIIEASWLFDVPASAVSVVLHRQSIVHALVEFVDGSVKAQLAVPDMRLPIIDALTHPRRLDVGLPRLDIAQLGTLTFEPVDDSRYPSVALARGAANAGGTHPAVLNAANEVAVERFLRGSLRFTEIVPLVAATLDRYVEEGDGTEDVFAADAWGRRIATQLSPGTSFAMASS